MIWGHAAVAFGLGIIVLTVLGMLWPRYTRIVHESRVYYRNDLGIYTDESGNLVRDPQVIAALAEQLRRHARG